MHAGLGWWKRCGSVVHAGLGGGKGVVVLCMLYWYSALGLDEKCILVWNDGNG